MSERKGVRSLESATETRRKRELATVAIRKQKREELLLKRRHLACMASGASAPTPSTTASIPDVLTGIIQMFKTAETPQALATANEALSRVLPEAVRSLASPDRQVQLHALVFIRQLLSIDNNPPIEAVVQCGESVELVVAAALGAADAPEVQYEAAWCVTNIASGTAADTARLVACGAVPRLVALLAGAASDVLREQALWALGNIAGDGAGARDAVLAAPGLAGAVQAAVRGAGTRALLRTAAWALLLLCRGDPAPPLGAVRALLPALGVLLHSRDGAVAGDACAALLCVATGASADGGLCARVDAVVALGVVRRVTELLYSPAPGVAQCAVRLLGRVAAGTDAHTQTVINVGALPALRSLLASADRGVRQDACWALSNITAGRREQVEAVLAADLLPPLLAAVRSPELDVRREAAYAVANACCAGAVPQVQEAARAGALDALCGLLAATRDSRLLATVLEALERIVRAGDYGLPGQRDDDNVFLRRADELGAVAQLEALAERHTDAAVVGAAERLLRRFSDAADDDEAGDFLEDDEEYDEADGGDDDAFRTLMDAAANATTGGRADDDCDDDDDENGDVISVPDMPSAGPAAVPPPVAAVNWGAAQAPSAQQQPSLFFQ